MKKLILILMFIIIPFFSFAETSNVGIIKGIWFSDADFFDGDALRIYTAVQNNSGSDVEGIIEFFDNGESLGTKPFSALNSRIIESWIDTVAVSGNHEFSVKITQISKNDVGVDTVSITAQEVFSERLAVIKIDTDGDDISDDIDADDDGDGYLDSDEIAEGSDPLDSQSIPVLEEVEDNSEQNNNENIITIIKNIFTDNSSDDKEDSKKTEKQTEPKLQNELLEQSPLFAQQIAEQNSLIESLVLQVSKLQNGGKSLIEHEQQRVIFDKDSKNEQVSGKEKVVRINNKKEVNVDEVTEVKEKSSFKNILIFMYGIFLNLFGWLFSVWWFVVILLFLGIYILLRLLFKIFGRNRD